jgi:hypothetical protein
MKIKLRTATREQNVITHEEKGEMKHIQKLLNLLSDKKIIYFNTTAQLTGFLLIKIHRQI